MRDLLQKELKIVEKYSVEIRDLYDKYHRKRMDLTKQMEEELKIIKAKEAEQERNKLFRPHQL